MFLSENLANKIKEHFAIKQDELEKIELLLLFSFFLGIFVAFYFVPANAEFVLYFGSAQLPYAYIVSGIVGTIALLLYSAIQRRSYSKKLFLSALIIMFFIAILSRVSLFILKFVPQSQALFYKKVISFFVFVWAWPFIALTATITGGLAIKLFNLLEVKKFYGMVNLGGVIAAILSYFSIPLILKLTTHHYDLIILGSLGIIASIFLLNYIYKKFPDQGQRHIPKENRHRYKRILKNFSSKNFLIWIFVGAIFSTIAIYIADFGFLITIKHQKNLFTTTQAVARFMSIVFGALKVGEFIISLLSGRILTRYGLRFGLVFLSLSITTFEILAFLAGYMFGIESIAFLAMMTCNKMFERIFRRGIDDPSFNVLYQTLPNDLKLYVQTRVGVVQQSSIAFAGIILSVIQRLLSSKGYFHLELYPLYTLPVLLVWLFVAIKLYRSYKQRIHHILAEKRLFKLEYVEKDIFASDILQKYLLTDDVRIAKFSVVVLSETNPKALEDYANFLLKIDDKIIRRAVLNNIDATYSAKLVETIEKVGNQIGFKERELRRLILKALYQLDYTEISDLQISDLERLVKSDNVRDKILAAKFLYKNELFTAYDLIEQLLECEDKAVRFVAIKLASRSHNERLYKRLVMMLSDSRYNNFLVNIFIEIGEPILDLLDEYFETIKDKDILEKIIQIYSKIGTERAKKMLVSHLNYPDRDIEQSIIYGLSFCEYKVGTEAELELIKDKIYQTVENIVWFYATIKDIVREKNTLKLIQSLDLELTKTQELLFIMLTFLHSKDIIELIKINIIGENTIFAIELIDNFIRPDIKRLIIPLFEKISLGQKIKKLRKYFDFPPMEFRERLSDIILQDYRKIDLWSHVKAIEVLGKYLVKDKEFKYTANIKHFRLEVWEKERVQAIARQVSDKLEIAALVTNLFHPHELICTTAAKILYGYDKQLLLSVLDKMDIKQRELIARTLDTNDYLLDRIKLLKRIYLFYTIPEKSLISLAKLMRNIKLDKGQKVRFMTGEKEDVIIVIKGKLIYEQGKEQLEYVRNSVIIRGLNVSQNAEALVVEKNANLLLINRFEFFNLLAMNNELVGHLFDRMMF